METHMNAEEKVLKAKEVRAAISKDIGEGSIMNMADAPNMNIEVISTGSIGLDLALGVGGLPRGRIVEIMGMESSGKTTLAIHIMVEAQKLGGMCGFIDAEHAFDREYAEALGLDTSRLDICQPDSGDQGLEVADRLIESGVYDVVVIDSVAALVPKAELEGDMGEAKIGLQARLMSQACRKMTASIKRTNTLVIFINQYREKIGVLYGSPLVTSGGNALKFYSSIRMDITRSTTEKNSVIEDGVKIGNKTTVSVIKNKVARPFTKTEFDILYGEGIDQINEIIEIGKDLDILSKRKPKGSDVPVVTYGDMKYSIDEFTDLVKHNPEFKQELRNKIEEKLYGKTKEE